MDKLIASKKVQEMTQAENYKRKYSELKENYKKALRREEDFMKFFKQVELFLKNQGKNYQELKSCLTDMLLQEGVLPHASQAK